MRTKPCRGIACAAGVLVRRRFVPSHLGVVREPGLVRCAGGQRSQDRGVKGAGAVFRYGALDREPRQLVPKHDGAALFADDAGREACVQRRNVVVGDFVEQPQLRPRRHQRRDLEQPPTAVV
jgi:hypothetical protein